jgi:hypothetical protein
MNTRFSYFIYGLHIDSEVELPELHQCPAEKPDAIIRKGTVPESLLKVLKKGMHFESNENEFLLRVDGVAKYYVTQGEIIIAPNPSALESDIRVFLLSLVLGALLQKHGFLCLHGSAILYKEKAVIFTGNSGMGKSTLAAVFMQKGFSTFSDDICAIKPNVNKKPILYRGPAYLKLWDDSLQKLALGTTGLVQVRNKINKYMLGTSFEKLANNAEIRKIYVLTPSNKNNIQLEHPEGIEKFRKLQEQIYKHPFITGSQNQVTLFEILQQIITHIPCSAISRPMVLFNARQIAEAVISDLENPIK